MARTVREVLADAQRIGALGPRHIDEVIAHASAFVDALPVGALRVIDLGTGAGIPGLVIADARRETDVVLVDRRAKRTDALAIAVAGLGWRQRVSVVCADVDALTRNPEFAGSFDAVVSRGFGPHETTLELSSLLTRSGGVVILSEPPAETPNRWRPDLVARLGLDGPERLGPVVRFTRR